MKFSHTQAPPARIDLTSLIDVVFMLLLFFVLTTSFEKKVGLTITLPEASASRFSSAFQPLYIQIDQTGALFIDGRQIPAFNNEALLQGLRVRMIEDPSRYQLLIQADARAPHQSVVRAIASASLLEVGAIGIVTTNP